MSANNALVIGSGGREHTIAKKLALSDKLSHVFVAPGNAGTENENKCSNIDLNLKDFKELAKWCKTNNINLVFVGPEDPLANGIVDSLKEDGVRVFGPSAKASQIEASKSFSKEFMSRHNIPTARYALFTDSDKAAHYINTADFDALVVKATGLAAGKGVIVAKDKAEAVEAVKSMLDNKTFGVAGESVLVEELLVGEEVSCLAFSDGERIVCLPPSQDHKRLNEGDAGPNTGGMGAYCPCPLANSDQLNFIKTNILQKTIDGLKKEGIPFQGVLYAGLILTKDGPKVLEFNCRFGDPETQVLLPMLASDLYDIAVNCADGNLDVSSVKFHEGKHALCIVAVSGGYPNSYPKGKLISGLHTFTSPQETYVIHAGTKLGDNKSDVLTSGGRVLAVVSEADDLLTAQTRCLEGIKRIAFDGCQYRSDIGAKSLH